MFLYFCIMHIKSIFSLCTIFLVILLACNNDKTGNKEQRKTLTPAELQVNKFRKDLEFHPDSAGLRIKLISALDSIGAYQEALVQLDSLLKTDTLNYGLWFMKGQLSEDINDTIQAMESYINAIKIYPAPDALLSLANLYAEQKNERSLLICNQVKNMGLGRKYDADCAFISGVYHARSGHRELAIQLFDECIKNDYTNMPAYIEKGLVYFDAKQYRQALQVFQLASTINNLYADAYYYQARSYEMLNIKDSASLRYEQSLQLDKNLKEAEAGLKRLRN